jgi:exodeoxyribonuclease III
VTSSAIRLVSWNVENLARWLDLGSSFADHVARLGAPQVLCLQEVRIRAHDALGIPRMRALVPGYTCTFSLCNDPRNVKFRGGRAYGVATYVHESMGDARELRPAWDREGRVVATILPAQGLAIVNLYAVNGTDKPYLDPITGEPRGDRHDHKRRFQDQLFAFAAELREQHDVVLAGDWNVSRAAIDVTPRLRTEEPHRTARAQLDQHLSAGGWIDVFRHSHPDTRAYSWYGRTRGGRLDAARVDYIVTEAELLARVEQAEILDDVALRPHSDHAPISVQLTAAS